MSKNINSKRILGIIGSPRRGGNTEILVDEVLIGAEEAGARIEKVFLSELDIRPCRACEACKKAGKCVQRDDMPALLELMQHSQVWVLGTPVYFWGPTAQFKAFIDRFYGARYNLKLDGQRDILVVPLEDSNAETARHTIGMLTDALTYLKMEIFATLVTPGLHHRGEARKHPDFLAAARRTGRKAFETMTTTG